MARREPYRSVAVSVLLFSCISAGAAAELVELGASYGPALVGFIEREDDRELVLQRVNHIRDRIIGRVTLRQSMIRTRRVLGEWDPAAGTGDPELDRWLAGREELRPLAARVAELRPDFDETRTAFLAAERALNEAVERQRDFYERKREAMRVSSADSTIEQNRARRLQEENTGLLQAIHDARAAFQVQRQVFGGVQSGYEQAAKAEGEARDGLAATWRREQGRPDPHAQPEQPTPRSGAITSGRTEQYQERLRESFRRRLVAWAAAPLPTMVAGRAETWTVEEGTEIEELRQIFAGHRLSESTAGDPEVRRTEKTVILLRTASAAPEFIDEDRRRARDLLVKAEGRLRLQRGAAYAALLATHPLHLYDPSSTTSLDMASRRRYDAYTELAFLGRRYRDAIAAGQTVDLLAFQEQLERARLEDFFAAEAKGPSLPEAVWAE